MRQLIGLMVLGFENRVSAREKRNDSMEGRSNWPQAAAWLSRQVPMHASVMPGKRYDVGDVESYREVCKVFEVSCHRRTR